MIVTLLNFGTVINGTIREKITSDYSVITDELAKRTYAESGDYYVKSFGLNVKESLTIMKEIKDFLEKIKRHIADQHLQKT